MVYVTVFFVFLECLDLMRLAFSALSLNFTSPSPEIVLFTNFIFLYSQRRIGFPWFVEQAW